MNNIKRPSEKNICLKGRKAKANNFANHITVDCSWRLWKWNATHWNSLEFFVLCSSSWRGKPPTLTHLRSVLRVYYRITITTNEPFHLSRALGAPIRTKWNMQNINQPHPASVKSSSCVEYFVVFSLVFVWILSLTNNVYHQPSPPSKTIENRTKEYLRQVYCPRYV